MSDIACTVTGCEKRGHGRSRYCSMHEHRIRKHGSTELPQKVAPSCRVEGCEGTYQAKNLCQMHYSRWQRTGSLDARPRVDEIFWSRVAVGGEDDCWPWLGSVSSTGYGRVGKRYAHRIACERTYGPPPAADSVVLHACDNPPCANPAHISWGTQSENVAHSYQRGRR